MLGLVFALRTLALGAAALGDGAQVPLHSLASQGHDAAGRRLTGRYLHITDIHPDPFFKVYSSTSEESACHHGSGVAGLYGAETTDCDSPIDLVNATFQWIKDNLRDQVDFVVWTGDSARHDNDESIPRSRQQVVDQNTFIVDKFRDVFGRSDHERQDGLGLFRVPIVPTFGNNDILPHNIFTSGPNSWTETYAQLWRDFIPEEQRHQFERGGWFYVEVIPNRLAVFSLNTLYFFNNNAAVDGCADPKEPGAEHFQWLRIQLQLLRERGLKVILSGHVPPARTSEKQSWDETCWQKYTLWLRQYRDIIIGANYGHINIEHFMLQDFNDIDWDIASLGLQDESEVATELGALQAAWDEPAAFRPGVASADTKGDLTIANDNDYLISLREIWGELPSPPRIARDRKGRSSVADYHKKIGGPWAQRFAVAHASASVVPNYFPALRVFEYNISGLEHERFPPWNAAQAARGATYQDDLDDNDDDGNDAVHADKHKKKKKKKKKHPKNPKPNFQVPKGPSKGHELGPAYRAQPLSWIGYTQYYSNITWINNDFNSSALPDVDTDKWHDGKHKNKHPKHPKPQPRDFNFSIEYDTQDKADVYGLQPQKGGLNVRGHVELAARIGRFKSAPKASATMLDWIESHLVQVRRHGMSLFQATTRQFERSSSSDLDEEKKKKKKKKHKKHGKKRRIVNRTWYAFVDRATVATRDAAELHDDFGEPEEDLADRASLDMAWTDPLARDD